MNARILIVEDEAPLANGLRFNFEQEGFHADIADNGADALGCFEADQPPDLVILDLMLPRQSGYEICRQIREVDQAVPILVLSARTLPEDKALAFDCGCDQYVTKPFNLPELLSRVRNLLERRATRHTETAETTRGQVVRFGENRVDFNRFEVTSGQETYRLTTMEQQLFRYFIENEGLVLSRTQILADVWKDATGITTRSIDNFVMRLRKYIELNPAEPRHIVSVRGTGYRFVASPNDVTGDDTNA